MIYLAYLVFGFTSLQLVIAIINLATRVRPGKEIALIEPLVSVLIPARNEQDNIGIILENLVRQDYRKLEIIVFDDQSEDQTAAIVKQFHEQDDRVRLIRSDNLPEGWLGKNYACHSLSLAANGEYLLFVDADVRIGNGIIAGSVDYASRFKLALVSIFPKQVIVTRGEMMTVPVMNYILLSLLPLILVRRSSFHSLAAANGQFMLFNSDVYRSIYPHRVMRSEKVEDIRTARYLKKKKYSIACLTGNDSIRCRMYKDFREAVSGFSKNVTAFFGNSLLVSIIFWLVTTFGFIAVVYTMPLIIVLSYIIIYVLTRIVISIASEQKVMVNMLYVIPQQVALGIMIFHAMMNKFTGGYRWKGRSVK